MVTQGMYRGREICVGLRDWAFFFLQDAPVKRLGGGDGAAPLAGS